MSDIDPTAATILVGAVSAVAGYVSKALVARTTRSEREDTALARVLERRDEDCRRLGDLLDAARHGEQLASVQAAHFGAQLEDALPRIAKLEAEHEECDQLRVRVVRMEEQLRKLTPPKGTPAVESSDRIKPVMHESVGGYRGIDPR